MVWWGGAEAVAKAVARALQSALSSTAASPTTCHFYKDKTTQKKRNVSVRAVIAAGRNDACIPQEKHANQRSPVPLQTFACLLTCNFSQLLHCTAWIYCVQ